LYFVRTVGSRSPVGSSVMKSRLPLITSWVTFETLLDTRPVILSILPFATPGTLKSVLRVMTYSRLGSITLQV
jgi:hypothetical protein